MLKLFKNFNKKDYLYMFIAIVFVVLQVILDLRLPDYMSNITTLVQTTGVVGDILKQGIYMLICAFGSLFIWFFLYHTVFVVSFHNVDRCFNQAAV